MTLITLLSAVALALTLASAIEATWARLVRRMIARKPYEAELGR